MSGYCSVSDVNSMITGWDISDTSNITKTEVENDIIPQVDHWIDDRLRNYYKVPITGVDALKTMNRIARWYVAAEVAERTYIGESPSDSPQSKTWRKLADDDMKRIVNGEIILTDAVPTGNTPETEVEKISDRLSVPGRAPKKKFSMGMRF